MRGLLRRGAGTEGGLGLLWVPKAGLEGKEDYSDQTPLALK